MKHTRIILLAILLLSLSGVAKAWNAHTYATIVSLAERHLTAETALATKQALGCGLSGCDISKSERHILHLSKDYAPLRSGEEDALLVAERCVEALKRDPKDGKAILLLARAVADMHSVTNTHIEGNELSIGDFKVSRWNNRQGKLARYTPCSWHILWNNYYSSRKAVFTPQLYAEDVEMFYGGSRGGYAQGAPEEWAADMGRECRAIYARGIVVNHALRQETVNELEYTHDRLLAKAAYRLAALLNSLIR